jgi:hypothetical protein
LGGAERISNSSNVVLSGGTFSTGSTTGFSETVGTLSLSANSTIALGTGNHSLTFAASNGVTWTGTTLTVTGWTGTAGASGTAGKIFVGNSTSGLTSGQLAKISFDGYSGTATILSTGEVVPEGAGPTASVLSNGTGNSTICAGGIANIKVTITGGASPYTVVYSDGTNNFTVNNYISGANIMVSPVSMTTYSLVSVTDNNSLPGSNNSGSAVVTATSTVVPASVGTYTATLNHTDGATLNYIDGSCNLLARIEDAAGGNVLGSTTTNLTISSTAIVANNNVGYVRREYEITPASNGTSTVTLYFTQADFDDFNATNGTQFDIATGPGDAAGISNIKMVVFTGGDVNDGTRNNLTSSVFWNASESRWEVTATTSIYGYFYVFGDVTCPNVISNITFNNLTATSVIVNWNNASVPEYGIRTRPVGSPVWTNITSSNTNSKTFLGLTPNTTYEIQIRALCSVNERGAYSTSSFTTPALSCSAPSGFVTSNITSNSATLTWNPVAAANSYSIRIKPNSSGTWNNTSSSTNSRVFLGLLANTLYDVEVRTNCTNLGSVYVSYQFTTLASTCTVVSNIESTSVTSNSANITWDAVASAISYGIRIKPASSGIWNNTSSATNSRNFIGLLANTTYDIEIRSNCNGEASSYVGYQFTTLASTCTVPVNFTTTELSSNSVTIIWDVVASAQSYGIRFKPSSSSNWTNNTTSNTNSRTVVGLMPGTSYDFQFRSNCIGESSAFSPTYTILTNTSFNSSDPTTFSGRSSGVGEISSVKIYPNPTAEVLYVSFEAAQAVGTTIRVTDVTGRVVREISYNCTEGYNQTEISFGDLAQGVYMLQVSSGDGWLYTGRVVKTE